MGKCGRFGLLVLTTGLILSHFPAPAQEPKQTTLRVEGLYPYGGRTSVTEGWCTLRLSLTNLEPRPRSIRVLVFYAGQPDVRYGRDLYIPGESRMTSWLPIGPAPAQTSSVGREIMYLLYDQTDGEARLLTSEDERLRSRAVAYRKRNPTTAILLERAPEHPFTPDPVQVIGSPSHRALTLARSFRQARGLSEAVSTIREAFLPPTATTLDGVDHFIVASNRLAEDPVARRALRHWVQQGGSLWVMLDLVDPEAVAPVLGDELGFEIVGRTTLTSVQVLQPWEDPASSRPREFEEPVPLVRVALDGSETVLFEVDGWPAAFTKSVGRGKVLFTTLGAEAWYRPRTERDPRSPFDTMPNLPVALRPLERLAVELQPEKEQGGLQPDDVAPIIRAEIGYSVLGLPTVAVVLVGFALVLLVVGWVVRQSRRSGAVGWLVPVAAIGAAGLLTALGTAKRQEVPPTTGTVAVAEVDAGSGEAAVEGVFAVYRPDPGPLRLSAEHGGNLELDTTGLEGQSRRRIQTDLDRWHWEGLALPAGVRTGPFRTTIEVGSLSAVARFGPGGLEGRLSAGRFGNLSDPVLLTAARGASAVHIAADGNFTSGSGDILPPGQYMSSTVLTDRQQRRQEVYRRFFSRPIPRHLEGQTVLLGWADSADPPFTTEPGDRTVGATLLLIPVGFERTPPGTQVIVPTGSISYTAVVAGRPARPTLEGTRASQNRLRFKLPPSVLPLTVERATLHVRVKAPSRQVKLVGYSGEQPVTLKEVESPIDPIRLDITDARLLRPDAEGCLYVGIEVSSRAGADMATDTLDVALDELWRIESIALEAAGRVEVGNGK
jgi:hypothetical protein